MLSVMILSGNRFSNLKPLDLVFHVVPDACDTLFGCGLRFAQDIPLLIRCRIETTFLHEQMELPNTSSQTIEPNPSCSGQAQSNRHGTGYGYESTDPGCTLTVFRVPSILQRRLLLFKVFTHFIIHFKTFRFTLNVKLISR